MTKVKFCGMMREDDVAAVNELRPDYIGFIFAPESRRYVSPQKAASMKAMLSEDIKAVGVFVDEDITVVEDLLAQGIIDIAQLHGNEDEQYIRILKERTGKPVIKAFGIASAEDVRSAEASPADLILLDTPGGGTGRSFDRGLLKDISRPYILAGGLDPENVRAAAEDLHPYGVDVSSGIETDGVKDRTKMKLFMQEIKSI